MSFATYRPHPSFLIGFVVLVFIGGACQKISPGEGLSALSETGLSPASAGGTSEESPEGGERELRLGLATIPTEPLLGTTDQDWAVILWQKHLYVLSMRTGKVRWISPERVPEGTQPLVQGNMLYYGVPGEVRALRVGTAELQPSSLQVEGRPYPRFLEGRFLYVDVAQGKKYVGKGIQHEVYSIQLGPAGQLQKVQWRTREGIGLPARPRGELPNPVAATERCLLTAIYGGLYMLSGGCGYDRATGEVLWQATPVWMDFDVGMSDLALCGNWVGLTDTIGNAVEGFYREHYVFVTDPFG